ncbi:MAG: LamG domain-containing protein [Candidatus Micrarchaeota archaeon]|nr:LamG domain-containing protein [Candidatus Micrarchaeota archaeon]
MALNSNKKGLFMTILILVLFLLILGELITFALLNVNYNNLDTSLALGSGSINYGKALGTSAGLFASASLSQAMKTLANYELNASMRKSNFISNTSLYLTYLMVNGTLPNVASNSIPANYLKSQMANLTISAYNLSLSSTLNLGAIVLSVNQSKPVISQSSPYTLSVNYVQNILLNSSAGKFRYQIPVNATLSLNNTPDLFYYQQGVPRNIRFSQTSNLTTLIGNVNATNGNYLASAYGPVYQVPTGAGGLTCGSLSTMVAANVPAFSFAPYNQMLILATSNAIGITGGASGAQCANQYGGLITYSINSVTLSPSIPWLAYPSATGVLGNIKNGQQVLISGNTLSVYSIQNLITAASGGYYFASPLTPSYLDRAQQSVLKQNPNGLFSFSTSTPQVGAFNSISPISYVTIPSNNPDFNGKSQITILAWVNLNNANTQGSIVEDANEYYLVGRTIGGVPYLGAYFYGVAPAGYYLSSTPISLNQWTQVGVTYNGANVVMYLNGVQSNTIAVTGNIALSGSAGLEIGGELMIDRFFPGGIANAQVYNKTLGAQQIYQLYQEGLNGLPPSNSGIVGWWPLNGNTNDYSGQGNNGIPTNVIYTLPTNYVRDSILSVTTPTALSPIPGLLNCNSNSQCSNSLLPHAYLGYLPLGLQQSSLQVANFNGLLQNSYINVANPNNALNIVGPLSISAWIYPTSATGLNNGNIYQQTGCNAQYMLFLESSYVKFRLNNGGISDLSYPVNGLNTWYNIVAVWDGSTRYIYINGTLMTQAAYSGTLQNHPNGVGSIGELATGCPNYDFIGQISNLQVYGGPLSSNQVKQLYRSGIQGLPVSSNALAGWWPLNGNPIDYSGNGGNGTIVNVNFPYFSGAYNAPGLSSITTGANEWQTVGIPRSG